MRLLKGQSDMIAVVLIVLIAIALLGVAYKFGLPWIQKSQDKTTDSNMEAVFTPSSASSLPSKITSVANTGGKDSVRLNAEGVTSVYPHDLGGSQNNNSIEFSFIGTVASKDPSGNWVSLTGGSCPPANGIIGQDEPFVVCAKVHRTFGDSYNTTYRIMMRELEDAERKNGYRINLVKHDASLLKSGGKDTTISLEFGDRRTEIVGSKTLITTDVKVLLY